MLGQTTTPPSTADQIAGVSGGEAVWLIVGIAAGLALLWAIPMYLDARRAYKAYKYLQIPLMEKLLAASEEGKLDLSEDQKGELVKAATKRFEATTGLARALMAFAVISILSVALVAVLVSDASDAPDLRKTIITALVSILGTIVGFYFGARTAEISQAPARRGRAEQERQEERERVDERERQEARERSGTRARSTQRERSAEREKPERESPS
jgi:signal transduction histidine kinase